MSFKKRSLVLTNHVHIQYLKLNCLLFWFMQTLRMMSIKKNTFTPDVITIFSCRFDHKSFIAKTKELCHIFEVPLFSTFPNHVITVLSQKHLYWPHSAPHGRRTENRKLAICRNHDTVFRYHLVIARTFVITIYFLVTTRYITSLWDYNLVINYERLCS